MAGGIAQAFYGGVPEVIVEKVKILLDSRLNGVVTQFMNTHCPVKKVRQPVTSTGETGSQTGR